MVNPLSHLSPSSRPIPPKMGPRQTQPDTLTLTFRVTTAYITHTCSTVQPPHAHAARTYLSSFSQLFYGLDPLIYLSRPSLLFFYIIASHSRFASRFLQPSHCDYLFVWSLNPGLISLLLPFCPAFFVKGTSAVHPSSCRPRSGLLRPKKLKGRRAATRAPALKTVYFSLFFSLSLSDLSGVCARCGKSLSFEITFLSFCFPLITLSRHVATIGVVINEQL